MPESIDKTIEWLEAYLDGDNDLGLGLVLDFRALIAAYRKLKKIALRLCHGCGGIVSGALDFPCPKCDSTEGTLLFRAYQKLNDQLATKEECLQNLEARITTRRETIAAQAAEIERLTEAHRLLVEASLDVVERNKASLTAADALRDRLETKALNCCGQCNRCATDNMLIAAYSATRTQENEHD